MNIAIGLKSVIVTGASSGIGKDASIALANAGYKVFGLARSYDRLVELSASLPDRFIPIEFDVTKPETFEKTVKDISSAGEVYGLVNNAGYVQPGAVEDFSMSELRMQFETNFFGLVGLTKQILPLLMQAKSGRIVNLSSMAGLVSLPLIGAYCATKHALEAVSDALRMELWDTGIKVININPGVIETNIHAITSAKLDSLTVTSPGAGHTTSRFARAYKKYLQDAPRGLPASTVTAAIVEAISSPNPKSRYIIGSAREKAGVRLRHFVPDNLFYSQVAKRIFS
ncbi:MAG TPA: SDR family oxidoreductase [Nitrososphaera sp.]